MCDKDLICIVCPNGCNLNIKKIDDEFVVTGNRCKRGKDFAISEIISPKRSICSTIKTTSKTTPRISVRTDGEIPLDKIFNLMKKLSEITIDHPIHVGDTIIENVLNSGVNIIATSELSDK